jgi:hypothetical protein
MAPPHGGDRHLVVDYVNIAHYQAKALVLGDTTVNGYIAVRHVRCTCLGKPLFYLAFRHLLFLKDSSDLLIYPIVLSIELVIYISPYN